MKLTFRGNSSEVPASIQFGSNSMEQTKITLIYRGYTYGHTQHPVVVPEEVDITLVCREYFRVLTSPPQAQSTPP